LVAEETQKARSRRAQSAYTLENLNSKDYYVKMSEE